MSWAMQVLVSISPSSLSPIAVGKSCPVLQMSFNFFFFWTNCIENLNSCLSYFSHHIFQHACGMANTQVY